MIIHLEHTTSREISSRLAEVRAEGGVTMAGWVLMLVVIATPADVEESIAAANAASFEHPCRVLVVTKTNPSGENTMDAEIRVGADAGSGEVIVVALEGELTRHAAAVIRPLLLPDVPVVTWWSHRAPMIPAEDKVGKLAQRRITDLGTNPDPAAVLAGRAAGYRPGDTDLTWTRLTHWRALLAAALDQPPYEPVKTASVAANVECVSADLLAGWLALRLQCPVQRVTTRGDDPGVHAVELERASGRITLTRHGEGKATLTAPNHPDRIVALRRRSLSECLSEELRRLDADPVYAEVLNQGWQLVQRA